MLKIEPQRVQKLNTDVCMTHESLTESYLVTCDEHESGGPNCKIVDLYIQVQKCSKTIRVGNAYSPVVHCGYDEDHDEIPVAIEDDEIFFDHAGTSDDKNKMVFWNE